MFYMEENITSEEALEALRREAFLTEDPGGRMLRDAAAAAEDPEMRELLERAALIVEGLWP